jgi:hypothetical protein
MNTVGDLLARDLSRKIEEIIKVDQADEQSVHTEVTEYVATDSIRDQYAQLLRAVAEAPAEPHEGVGVWVSGFFGSGKSSFAKLFGYALANPTVLNTPFSDLFKAQLQDDRLAELLDFVNAKVPTEAVMFDVSVDRATRKNTERVAELMYTVLLRELDYAEDYDVAELEIELEREGRLQEFTERCKAKYNIDWRMVRKGAQKMSRASAVLHDLDPSTYPTPDSWSHSLRDKSADISVARFVERAFDLAARRRKGKALVFILDEVGQYVARSADKIEDLRAVVEQFGKVGKNLLKARRLVGPAWVVVTSQEKLDEVVAAIDSRRVELAKLQDRFRYRVDLAPSDIREVATRRVLAKKPDAVPLLRRLYQQHQGQLNAACRLERTTRKSEVTEDDFVQFYPYLPHFVELSIAIMSGIRLQPGAPRHYGGSNRTIIKQAYEMLVSERTALASKPIGTLVTLDKVYELVEGNLSNEKRTDIHEIGERFQDNPEDRGLALRVAKVLCLLEFVRDLPRTEANVAAFLIDAVGQPAPAAEVAAALKRLETAQFVRNTDEGWKLQTAQEKNWDTERRGYLQPRPRERNEITRQALKDIFAESGLKTYRHRDLCTFRVGVRADGVALGDEGDIPVSIILAEDAEEFPRKLDEVRDESRQDAHKNDLYWVCSLTPEVDEQLAQVHASRQMVARYEQVRGQTRISGEEASCLEAEKNAALNHQARLRDKLTEALEAGQGVFRGVARDALGKALPEIVKKFLGHAVPDLYPKLEMGSRPLKGSEAEDVLKAANLNALPQVFYAGEQGLNLVVKDGAKFVPNPSCEVAREVLGYLVSEHGYGNRDSRTGKGLEQHFGGLGYGWGRDLLRLVLAVLFRAGSIEVSHGGRKFDSYTDPQARVPLTNNTAFKSALFTPVKPIDLKTLTSAVTAFEELTGDTVDVEKSAIATALKKFADEQMRQVLPVQAEARANHLPVVQMLSDYGDSLSTILGGGADECVQLLAGEGTTLKSAHDRVRKLRDALAGNGLADLRFARTVVQDVWPLLEPRGQDAVRPSVEGLKAQINSESFYDSIFSFRQAGQAIFGAYADLYTAQHESRAAQARAATEEVKGRPEWVTLPEALQTQLLHPLLIRSCATLDLPPGALACRSCHATVSQLDSDITALTGLKTQALAQLQVATSSPGTRVERVRLAEFFGGPLDSGDAVREAVERLRHHLLKLVDEGVKIVVE